METRKERYLKYREQIRHMREEDFPKEKTSSTANEGTSQITVGAVSDQLGAILPYQLYLKHRRKLLAIKIVTFVLVAGGFVVWWFLMQRR